MRKPPVPERENDFVMLGVIHGDRSGRVLLDGWLDRAEPDVVTLEFSHYGLNFRRTEGAALMRKAREAARELKSAGQAINDAALEGVLSYIDLPWEFMGASDYCGKHGAPLFLVDMDRFSSARLAHADELVVKENLRILLSGPDPCETHRQKAMARLFFEKGVKAFSYTEEMGVRDRHMSGAIARVMRGRGSSRVVHICGWQHLCDPLALYAAFYPEKVFIHDKALCV
jgi:hypothetical protein